MSRSQLDESVWQVALEWVLREHEQPLDDESRKPLVAWLNEDVRHRQAYEEAARAWLITGLVPPSEELPEQPTPCRSGE